MHCTTRFSPENIRKGIQTDRSAGMTLSAIAVKYAVARTTVHRWLHRPDTASVSSRPHHQPRRLERSVEERILTARAQRRVGPDTLAHELGIPASTIYKVLRRYGVNRLVPKSSLPAVRYEAPHPGALLHIDVKKLTSLGLSADPSIRRRWHGTECLHVAIDDHTRVAFCAVLPDERCDTAAAFLERATCWYRSVGVSIERVMTDRHPTYRSERFRLTTQLLGICQVFTRPRRPQTNGKCERLIRTISERVLRDQLYPSKEARAAALINFVPEYNVRRPHQGIYGCTPFQRLVECSSGL